MWMVFYYENHPFYKISSKCYSRVYRFIRKNDVYLDWKQKCHIINYHLLCFSNTSADSSLSSSLSSPSSSSSASSSSDSTYSSLGLTVGKGKTSSSVTGISVLLLWISWSLWCRDFWNTRGKNYFPTRIINVRTVNATAYQIIAGTTYTIIIFIFHNYLIFLLLFSLFYLATG